MTTFEFRKHSITIIMRHDIRKKGSTRRKRGSTPCQIFTIMPTRQTHQKNSTHTARKHVFLKQHAQKENKNCAQTKTLYWTSPRRNRIIIKPCMTKGIFIPASINDGSTSHTTIHEPITNMDTTMDTTIGIDNNKILLWTNSKISFQTRMYSDFNPKHVPRS